MKILCVAGARPNFMKIAPLLSAFSKKAQIEATLVHTGQHYDENMSHVFFEELGIPRPDINLEVEGGSREDQIERVMERFAPVLSVQAADAVLVVGDVNSTIACARVAARQHVKVVHVEAGLRSFDQSMPEEINRVETDQLSDLLYVTEPSGLANLKEEGIQGQAFLVGNVMIDTLVGQLQRARSLKIHETLGLQPRQYFVATFHRPSNVDGLDSLLAVLEILEFVAQRCPVVLPLHPRTRASLAQHGLTQRLTDNPQVRVVDPLGYLEFISLVDQSMGIVTDSGGVQEETTYLNIPCVTMRDNTERPITCDVGSNTLAGTDPKAVLRALQPILEGRSRKSAIPDLWDGKAAERIADSLIEHV